MHHAGLSGPYNGRRKEGNVDAAVEQEETQIKVMLKSNWKKIEE
jgi:hypothetical protein